ncbi:MAG: dockerin type I domain-containing protein [Planctomycetota bacterium]
MAVACASVIAQTDPLDVRIDFNNAATDPVGHWNTLDQDPVDDPTVITDAPLIDYNTGQATTVTVSTAGTRRSTASATWDPAKTGPAWLDPAKDAANDYFWRSQGDSIEDLVSMVVTLKGLTPGGLYTVELVSSHDTTSQSFNGRYDINGVFFDGSLTGTWDFKVEGYAGGGWMTWTEIVADAEGQLVLTATPSFTTSGYNRGGVRVNALRLTDYEEEEEEPEPPYVPSEANSINVDFNDVSAAGASWNVIAAPTSQSQTLHAGDGSPTTVTLATSGFLDASTDGHASASLSYPAFASAADDCFCLGSTDDPGSVHLAGLDPTKLYRIELVSSGNDPGTVSNVCDITVQGLFADSTPNGEVYDVYQDGYVGGSVLIWEAVTADASGNMLITIDSQNADPGSGGCINALRISEISRLSRHGFTWTFDGPVESGQFANGDYWVVGPVNVIDISPQTTTINGRTRSGSMINPSSTGATQGYDSAMYGPYGPDFSAALNVAEGVSAGHPLTLQSGTSLISSLSIDAAGSRPQLKTAAVLTVLDAPAPAGSFRPPYFGTDKTIRHNVSDLDFSRLSRLPQVGSTPSLTTLAEQFERVWLEHVLSWTGRYCHPQDNMPDYGRDIALRVGNAVCLLLLDYDDQEKAPLLINFVQYGLDLYAILEGGGTWKDLGGHMQGRKLPILFAGLVLGDQDMLDIGLDYPNRFQEDRQTWIVTQFDVGRPLYQGDGRPREEYIQEDVGIPEWGEQHTSQPNRDGRNWDAYYRTIVGTSVLSHALVANVLGLRDEWNHEPFFLYMDRYWGIEKDKDKAFTDFHKNMWLAYRDTTYPARKPGDADGDGDVDLDDFVILKTHFGSTQAAWEQGDFTGDGNVDLDDFVVLKSNFGS